MQLNKATIFGFAFILTTFIGFSVSNAAGITAREGLSQAHQAAKSWQADATLTSVSTTVLKEDGTAQVWTYSFLSPEKVVCARVIVIEGGEPRLQDLGECSPSESVSVDFVDSPVMLNEAVKAGFKPGETSDAHLAFKKDSAAPDRECWVVHTIEDFDKEKSVMRGWCVDPKTGQFVVRLNGESGPKKY